VPAQEWTSDEFTTSHTRTNEDTLLTYNGNCPTRCST